MRIAVIDDEAIFAKYLGRKVCELFDNRKCPYVCDVFTDSEKFIAAHNKWGYNLIFLDIDMPGMNGMEVATNLRQGDKDITIIFVSIHEHFVFESMRFLPFRFLRKSYIDEELVSEVDAYFNEIYKPDSKIKLKCQDKKVINAALSSIVCFFSIRHAIYCLIGEESYPLYSRQYTLEKLEKELDPFGFVRIHRSYLVNCRYISKIESKYVYLKVKSLDALPISLSRSSAVREKINVSLRGENSL